MSNQLVIINASNEDFRNKLFKNKNCVHRIITITAKRGRNLGNFIMFIQDVDCKNKDASVIMRNKNTQQNELFPNFSSFNLSSISLISITDEKQQQDHERAKDAKAKNGQPNIHHQSSDESVARVDEQPSPSPTTSTKKDQFVTKSDLDALAEKLFERITSSKSGGPSLFCALQPGNLIIHHSKKTFINFIRHKFINFIRHKLCVMHVRYANALSSVLCFCNN
jgi:hypothetical protein